MGNQQDKCNSKRAANLSSGKGQLPQPSNGNKCHL